MKRARLIADAVAVLCPLCGEPQPTFAGSEQWLLEDFAKAHTRKHHQVSGPTMTCVSCDGRFILAPDAKVMFR